MDVDAIFERIKEVLGYSGRGSDARLAEWFGKSQNQVATWRIRNSLPVEILITKCEVMSLDLNYLLTGTPSPGSSAPPDVATAPPTVDQRELGRLEGKVEAMERELEWQRQHIDDLKNQVFRLQHPPVVGAQKTSGSLLRTPQQAGFISDG